MTADYSMSLRFFVDSHRRGDIDNLIKSIMDGCQSVLYDNDRRVTAIKASITSEASALSYHPRAEVEIEAHGA